MEQEIKDYLTAAQFGDNENTTHRLVLEVPKSDLNIIDGKVHKDTKIVVADLPFTSWALLYFLFVRPDGKKSWITQEIEKSDYYKSLE